MNVVKVGRYEIKDIIDDQNLYSELKITRNSPMLLVLIRVLLGGVHIKNEAEEFDQLINFFEMRDTNGLINEDIQEYIFCINKIENILEVIEKQKLAEIIEETKDILTLTRELNKYKLIQYNKIQQKKEEITPAKTEKINEIFDVGEDDYKAIFLKERINNKFYESVLIEVLNFLSERNNKHYTSSFIYLYRAYEEISYAYPLIYSYKNGDYKQTFNNLKNFLSDDKNSGELKFCKTFIKQIFKSELDQEIEIDFSNLQGEEKEKIISELKKKIIISNFEFTENEEDRFVIKCEFLFDLVIEIRNKFFHKLRGTKKYIEVKELNIENILSLFMDIFILWFAKITLTVVKEKIN